MTTYIVAAGDSMLSIAQNNGFFWETLWNHPQNAKLKELRKDPELLAPGDEVFIPDLRVTPVSRPTEATHKFKLKGVPAKLKIQLTILDQPRANERYVLKIDDQLFEGTTDSEGHLEHFIPPNASGGELQLNDGKEIIPVRLGHLNPVDLLSGVQQRLNNLGLYCAEDGEMSDETAAALRGFQAKHGLPVTGEADSATKAKLQDLHP